MNKTSTYILNAIFFQGFFKWLVAILIIGIFAFGNPQVREHMAKKQIYSYPTVNCEVVGKNTECHQ